MTEGPRSAEAALLMEEDRAFDLATSERGAEGWADHFASYGAMQVGDRLPIAGQSAIREAMAGMFAAPGTTLRWQPTDGGIWVPGRLGYTTGRYESRSQGEDGAQRVRTGRYVSIWRRQPDGTWKVIFDTGEEDAAAEK